MNQSGVFQSSHSSKSPQQQNNSLHLNRLNRVVSPRERLLLDLQGRLIFIQEEITLQTDFFDISVPLTTESKHLLCPFYRQIPAKTESLSKYENIPVSNLAYRGCFQKTKAENQHLLLKMCMQKHCCLICLPDGPLWV